jgi:hypothetical protein
VEYARTRYLAVATVESAPDMISALAEKLCWPEIHLGHKNKSPKSLASDEDRELAKQLCAQFGQHDMALYDYVKSQPGGFIVPTHFEVHTPSAETTETQPRRAMRPWQA